MTRFVNAALAVLVLVAAPAARAQVRSATDRAAGIPAGLALPVPGVAVAEEAAGLGTTPAAAGFVDRLALQYFREGAVTPGSAGDGLYAATRLGPLGVGGSMEWLRPGEGAPRYRRSRFALSLGDGRAVSAGVAWTGVSSPDPALARVAGWDVGLTVRPLRTLSIGAAMLERDAGPGIPVRYDVGVATRLLGDALTLSADLIADDRDRGDFRADYLTLGAAAETRFGLALTAQVQIPVRSPPPPRGDGVLDLPVRDVTALLALSWNGPHSGFTGGATSLGSRTGWLTGVRLSSERYRAAAYGEDAPTIDLDDELSPRRTLFFDLGEPDPYGSLLGRLERARDDAELSAVVIRITDVPVGAGRVEELRAALVAIAARKPVLAYLTGGGTRGYWLATAASSIAAPPGAPLFVNGIGTSQLYLKDALARLGVTFDVVKAGAYKSATEPLVRTEPSPEAREATEALLDDLFGRFVADVGAARKLAPERVRALVDQGLFTSEEARDAGLLDAVLWPDELDGHLRTISGRRLRAGGRYRPEAERAAQRWGLPPVVQVVRVEGVIAQGKSREPFGQQAIAGAETVAASVARAAADGRVKAIVLRIESPGGDGLASDLVWREVVRARRKGKPVIASLGDVAASGGYFIAVGADTIVAEPSTITGSIGVFAAKPDLSGLLGKLSLHRSAFRRGENAELTSLARPWSASERAVLERQIAAFYTTFLDRVAEGRKLTRADVEKVAGGRVWSGQQALERHLVDRLGSLQDALALARERAGLGTSEWVEIRVDRAGRGARGPPAGARARGDSGARSARDGRRARAHPRAPAGVATSRAVTPDPRRLYRGFRS
jgi:protease IV